MRFYLVTFEQAEKRSHRGMTSATLAADAIRDMERQGWLTSRIQRGSTDIDKAGLAEDVEREKSRPR